MQRVANILGAPIIEEVHNHYNFAWRKSKAVRTIGLCAKDRRPPRPRTTDVMIEAVWRSGIVLDCE